MSKSLQNDTLKTSGIVLRRTNYGEADRIINLITPVGKVSAIAKGARREKSKLAGGIEMFLLSDYVIRFSKSDMGIVASAKMVEHFEKIMSDYDKMELAGVILKKISAVDAHESRKYFEITLQCLRALNNDVSLVVIESWFWLNMMEAMGEGVNLYRDTNGDKLQAGVNYKWDVGNSAFIMDTNGEYGTNEIKMLRLMLTMELAAVARVKTDAVLLDRVLRLSRIAAGL